MSTETIKVPDMGGAEKVEVIEICVAVGDEISVEQSLIVLESDKASMEVPSPKAGKVTKIHVKIGDELSEGDMIVDFESVSDGSVEEQPAAKETEAPSKPTSNTESTQLEQKTTPSASVAENSTQTETVMLPDLGTPEAVDIIELCVAIGDRVSEGDSLIVLESDKASMEVPSPFAGVITAFHVKVGSTAVEGDAIVDIEKEVFEVKSAENNTIAEPVIDEGERALEKSNPASKVEPTPTQVSASISEARPSKDVHAGPAVRMMARELGVDLGLVAGSGPKQRILKEDLQGYVKQRLSESQSGGGAVTGTGIPSVPEINFSQFGEITTEKLSRLHKITATNMHRSWLNVPHVTQFDDADITDLEQFRQSLKAEAEKRKTKITPLPFLLKACAAALKANPAFNASLHADGEQIVYKHYVHIGIAVATPAGLMVPVVRDVDKKTIWELAQETAELAQKAKDRKLSPDEMQGGCFTISSLGSMGGTGFTPIVNTPEVGILGVSKLAIKPVWNGSEFEPKKMLPLCLSYDHRAVNGADAGEFMTFLVEVLKDIRRLSL